MDSSFNSSSSDYPHSELPLDSKLEYEQEQLERERQQRKLQKRIDKQSISSSRSYLKTGVIIFTWIELILGLSAISCAAFLNKRVPVLLYAFYGAYLGIFLWLLYTSCRSTYLKSGPLNHTYWIFGGCTLATIGVVLVTFLTAPNSGEIAFISLIVFLISLVLFPFICAVFYCFLRGNFQISLNNLRAPVKSPSPQHPQNLGSPNGKMVAVGVEDQDSSTTELQNGFHQVYTPTQV